ncbi:MAG: TetR/AcrR family transcriptional regulator, partial [Proteobacteria bacterium]|nr:TetR/AcrR family transcriptional regulator [Pseudomonadota bacterium]
SATNHFTRYGYRKTSIDEIIKDAKVGKGTVYNYFKNKEELFKRVAEIEYEIMFAHLKKLMPSECEADKKLTIYVTRKIQYLHDFFATRGSDPGIFKELKESYNQMAPDNSTEIDIITEILRTVTKAGIMERASILSIIINQFELRWIEQKKEDSDKEIAALFEMFFKGIRR